MEPGAALRQARTDAGLSQRALASLARVAQPSIARIESGTVMPGVDTFDRLLSACGVRLAIEPAADAATDRSAIDAMLRLTPAERLGVATLEARNLARLLEGRWR